MFLNRPLLTLLINYAEYFFPVLGDLCNKINFSKKTNKYTFLFLFNFFVSKRRLSLEWMVGSMSKMIRMYDVYIHFFHYAII